MVDSSNFKTERGQLFKLFFRRLHEAAMSMSHEEKDNAIKDLQEENANLEKGMHKLSKRNKKLENDLQDALNNLAIAEAEKEERAAYKPSDYDIYQTAISDLFETLKKNEEKEIKMKTKKTTEYAVFAGQQR